MIYCFITHIHIIHFLSYFLTFWNYCLSFIYYIWRNPIPPINKYKHPTNLSAQISFSQIPIYNLNKEFAESSKNTKIEYHKCTLYTNQVETHPQTKKTKLNTQIIIPTTKLTTKLRPQKNPTKTKIIRTQTSRSKNLDYKKVAIKWNKKKQYSP